MMRKVLITVGIGAVIVGIGVAVGLLGSGGSESPVAHIPEDASEPSTSPELVTHPVSNSESAMVQPVKPTTTFSNAPAARTLAMQNTNTDLTNWEETVDDILASDGEDSAKVKQLLEMFPKLSEDGQVEVAQHLSNLVDDADYAPVAELLKNAKLPEPVLDVLMGDVLNRPNASKLPLLLEVARTPDHAKAEEARDLLELYLDENYGTDWAKWQEKTKEWLKQNPD
ncbi:MAG: hypothetical protein QOD03_137 [Verrucomicrobiota bacterium]|jgi:hypothetical protein